MEVKEKDCEELGSPMKKKHKNSLESRLNDILCCVVCLDLPSSSVMQVTKILSSGLPSDKVNFILLSVQTAILCVLPVMRMY